MQIFCTITAKNGQRVPLLLDDPVVLTPTQLRKKVAETTRIPLSDLRLIFRGRMIKDDDSIPSVVSEYKLEDESVLHCMGKPVPDTNSSQPTGTSTTTTAAPAAAPANRAVVPPLSTPVATATAPAARAPSSAAAAAASGSGGDALSKALARLRQHNPPSVYVTAVGTLEKVLGNIAANPMEEKYRRVKRNNAAFGKRLGKLTGGHDCMLACGFVVEIQSGEEVYQLHASPSNWTALLACQARVKTASSAAKADQSRARQPPTAAGIGGAAAAAASAPGGTGFGGGTGGLGGTPMANMMMNNPNLQNMMSQMMSNPEALGQALQVRTSGGGDLFLRDSRDDDEPQQQQQQHRIKLIRNESDRHRNNSNQLAIFPLLSFFLSIPFALFAIDFIPLCCSRWISSMQDPMFQEMIRNNPNVPPETRRQMEAMASNPAMMQQLAQQMRSPAVQARLQRAMQSGAVPGMGGMGMGGGMGGGAPSPGGAAAAPPPPPQNDQGQTEEEMIAEAIRRSLQDS